MINKEELCEKIIALYPDIGECGIDVNVEFDKDQDTWVLKSLSLKPILNACRPAKLAAGD